ncbi:hypothetical protein D3C83_319360 [compost metagenome]
MSTRSSKKVARAGSHDQFVDRLRELRAQIVASGTPLLDWDDLQREALERRLEEETPPR